MSIRDPAHSVIEIDDHPDSRADIAWPAVTERKIRMPPTLIEGPRP